jgi:protein-tyrosine-phosphatase
MRFLGRGNDDGPAVRVMFMCVENAGRSQMAAALAEREREQRGLGRSVEINSAGTHPADEVHGTVVDAMAEIGIDISERVPRVVDLEHLGEMDYVVMMGCYVAEFDPGSFGGETREWSLRNPADADVETVREVRDELEARVGELFDELEQVVSTDA